MVKIVEDIEKVLWWVYQEQRADIVENKVRGDLLGFGETSRCGCASVARIQELGIRPDVLGYDNCAIHPDAEIIHAEVMALGLMTWGLIVGHAKAGTRPEDPRGVIIKMEPVYRANGKIRKIWDHNNNWVGCRVRSTNSLENVNYMKDLYFRWFDGMEKLARNLADREGLLCHYRPSPPGAWAPPSDWAARRE